MSSHAHEPRDEFVDQLESRLRADFRRQLHAASSRPWSWIPQSRLAAAVAFIAVVMVSMALGGGVVAATYEGRLSEQRDMLLGTYEQRQVLANQRLQLVKRQLEEMERRVSVGLEQGETVLEMRVKVNEAESELRSIALDLEEIRATSREPKQTMSAPVVSGRDFVTERWRVEMVVPTAALEFEKKRAEAARGRVAAGIAKPSDVDEVVTRIAELEATLSGIEQKLAIRQTFLKGGMTALMADLRGLEVENEVRRRSLIRRIELAQRRATELKSRVDIGTANVIELSEAELRVQALQFEAKKAEYELLLIRKQLGK